MKLDPTARAALQSHIGETLENLGTKNTAPEQQLLTQIKKCLKARGEFGYFPLIPAGYYLIYPNSSEYVLVDTEIVKTLFSRGLIEIDSER
ncbi:MAG: hypothetical protein ABFS56_19385 [Pseudomonadota bacterium]